MNCISILFHTRKFVVLVLASYVVPVWILFWLGNCVRCRHQGARRLVDGSSGPRCDRPASKGMESSRDIQQRMSRCRILALPCSWCVGALNVFVRGNSVLSVLVKCCKQQFLGDTTMTCFLWSCRQPFSGSDSHELAKFCQNTISCPQSLF